MASIRGLRHPPTCSVRAMVVGLTSWTRVLPACCPSDGKWLFCRNTISPSMRCWRCGCWHLLHGHHCLSSELKPKKVVVSNVTILLLVSVQSFLGVPARKEQLLRACFAPSPNPRKWWWSVSHCCWFRDKDSSKCLLAKSSFFEHALPRTQAQIYGAGPHRHCCCSRGQASRKCMRAKSCSSDLICCSG